MKKILLLLIVVVLVVAVPQAAERVFRLADYGIAAGNADSLLCSRLRTALDEISSQLQPGDEAVVKLEAGIYNFHAADALPCEIYVSNHDQVQPKPVGIMLDGWQGVTIDGCGAQLVFHGRMLPIVVTGCERTSLRNFSIDFHQPQITQVQVVENRGEEGITFEVAPWVTFGTDAEGYFVARGEGWQARPTTGIAFEPDTRHIVYNTGDLAINTQGCRLLGERTLHAPQWCDPRLPAGTVVAMRTWYRPAPGILLDHSRSTVLEDVRVHYAEGMGLLAQRCTDIELRRFGVCLKGDDDPRYFTTQADATHFSQCRGLIKSEDGLYEAMMDDAINVHGVYLGVRERIDGHTMRCRYEHGQAWGFAWGDPGDRVAFVSSRTMEYLDSCCTIASIEPVGQDKIKGVREFLIRFVEPLPAEVDTVARYGVENLTWVPQVVFSGNTVRNNRARGALFSSPLRTECTDNLFDHTSGTAILLCGDCNGWYESGAVRDLVIRGNRFVNALTNMFQFTNAVISIYPEIPDLDGQRAYFHGGRPGAIVIEDNEFVTFDAPLLYAKSVDGLVFRRNRVTRNHDYSPFHWNQQPIKLERCNNVQCD